METRYDIDGMDCAACASKIEAAANRVEGVTNASATLSGKRLIVEHTPNANLEDVRRRVEILGYKLTSGNKHGAEQKIGRGADKPWWKDTKLLLAGVVATALALAFAMSQFNLSLSSWGYFGAMLVGLVPIGRRAVTGAILAGRPFSIESLMTIAAVGAVFIGATEEAAIVVLLFLIGEFLEGFAADRARASIRSLADLVPRTALLETGGRVQTVPAAELTVGSTVMVRPGERIPADGTVLSGESAVDEAPVTGESTPKSKKPSDSVFAGTINGDGVLRIAVTAAAEDNTIARVIRLVEEAQEAKAPTERFIDRFSTWYTPGVLVVAALVAVLPPLAAGEPWSEWIYKGLAILLIGCPCALVISTPAAIAAALSIGARNGLLIKGGSVLEELRNVTVVAFDKTGTLTQGKPQVTDVAVFGKAEAEVIRLAAAIETGSSHPLATAILAKAKAMNLDIPSATDATAISGKGVTGKLDGKILFLGSPRAVEDQGKLSKDVAEKVNALQEQGKTVSLLTVDSRPVGVIAMRDEPRADAAAALRELASRGIRTIMLTGDNRETAEAIGRELGIEANAEMLPEEKLDVVAKLRTDGHTVAKVGDGINDAPALAAANVGIAMGGGTDVALETGDAASLHGRVGDVPAMMDLSRRAMANIYQNITIALGLKVLFFVTTIAGITGLWPAILADTGATVLVTANALRLLWHRPDSI